MTSIKIRIISLLSSVLSISFLPCSVFAANNLTSGIYEQIFLAAKPNGDFVGYYRDSMGSAKVDCRFFFDGHYSSSPASIISWSDSFNTKGSIAPTADGVLFSVDGGDGHPGCSNLLPPDVTKGSGSKYSKTSIRAWTSLKVISSKRAYIYNSPNSGTVTKKYLIMDDVIGILSRKDDWYEFEFVGENAKTTKGWLPASDVKDLRHQK